MRKFRILIFFSAVMLLVSCGLREAGTSSVSVPPPKTDPVFEDSELVEPSVQTERVPLSSEEESDLPPDEPSESLSDAAQPTETEQSPDPLPSGAGRQTDPVDEPTAPSTETEPEQEPQVQFRPKAMMYHLIMEEPYNNLEALFVRPASFERQLSELVDSGFEFLFAEEWQMTSRPSVILTFDDGYEDNYTTMFPILKNHGAKATVFVIPSLVGTSGYLTVDQIKEMASSGLVSFQSHTLDHVDLSYQDEATLRRQFSESISIIEGWTGRPVRALAYPAGSYNDLVLSVVPEYFDFCYTTKSPYSVTEYTRYNIPRYYIARELTDAQFLFYIS